MYVRLAVRYAMGLNYQHRSSMVAGGSDLLVRR